jgi:hypothetical protein
MSNNYKEELILVPCILIVLLSVICAILHNDMKARMQERKLPCATEKTVMEEVCAASNTTWTCNHSQITYMACLRNEGYLLVKKEEKK